jgi:hypothetical protein
MSAVDGALIKPSRHDLEVLSMSTSELTIAGWALMSAKTAWMSMTRASTSTRYDNDSEGVDQLWQALSRSFRLGRGL